MAELLTDRFQFPSENVQVLVNEAATSAAIRALIEKQLPAGAVALYACGSVEREPAYQDGDRSYGLLTRFLTRVVNETNDLSKLSYGLLAETIPSPDKRGRALIAAGSFHGLTTGSLFQLYNTAEQIIAEEDQSVCWLRVEQVDLTSCTARVLQRSGDKWLESNLPGQLTQGMAVERYRDHGDAGARVRVVVVSDGQDSAPLVHDDPSVPPAVRQVFEHAQREDESSWLHWAGATEGGLRKPPDLQPLRNRLLTYYQNYVQQFGNSQDLNDEMAMELAGVFRRMATLAQAPPNPNLVDTLSQTWIERGVLLQETRQYEKAESDFIQARDALSLLCQRDTLVAESEEREFKRDLGRSYGYLGDVQITLGEYQKALHSYRKSAEIRQQVAENKPSDHEARFQLARGFRNLGHLSRLESALEMAIKWFTKAIDEDRRLVDEEPLITDYRGDLGRYSNDLGELLIDQGKLANQPEYFPLARKHLDEALEMNRELTLRNPNNMIAISALARTHVNLARLALKED